ncbi:hypothetical protein NDU88_002603 [Pleurodeles waltl]|uniref:Uncharacterized protein n=1 Tax=Pleurodeles waltl TaxID=8319 RepID=A0AAV7Q7K9_PLEWA|nr:hypothetical protein NDU88_002603 [Pleurodeles waltl]
MEDCSTIGPNEYKVATDQTLSNGNEHEIVKDNSTPTGEQAVSLTGEIEVVTAPEQLAMVEGGKAVIEGAVNKRQPLSTGQPVSVNRRSIAWDKGAEISSYINNDVPKRYETYNRNVTRSPATRYQYQEPLTQSLSNQPNGMEQEGRQEEYLQESSPSKNRVDWKTIEKCPTCPVAMESAQGGAWSRDHRQQIFAHTIQSEHLIKHKLEKERVYQRTSYTNSINWKETGEQPTIIFSPLYTSQGSWDILN